jgi:hypothetical protein
LRATARALVLACAAALGGVAACETVDLGTPPADLNACLPSQSFFVQHVWPEVLSKDYGGKTCADLSCHGTLGMGGSLFLIGNPQPALDPTMPAPQPLPPDWASNYRATATQMSCSNVTASKLIVYPTGILSHGGGSLFSPDSAEAQTIEMWVTAP